ncbi:MAG: tetratricopeptide repeat protein, partial [Sphingomonas sp.]|nr:tetratricopeptide repeat protein [Sphingomonas sp.]
KILVLGGVGGLVAALGAGALWMARAPAAAPAQARHQLALSLRLLERGNATAARSWALKATRNDPSWGLAHAVLARSYLALGEGLAAQAALGRAKDAGFDMGRAHQLLAEALLLQGESDRALKEARKTPPRYAPYALRVAARALAAQGDLPSAQILLADVLRKADGKYAAAWVDLGRVRQLTGDVGGAIDAANRAIGLDRRNVDALTLRGELVRGQYGLVAALPWFESALKVDPWRYGTLIAYAATLGDAGRYGDMLRASRRAQAVRPGSADALYLQAVMAARAGNDDLARALLQRTGGGLDGRPGPLLLAGMIDYAGGGYQQAVEKWRAVVAAAPMNLVARRLLGAALLDGGDPRGAIEALRPVALRSDADSYTLQLVGRAFEATGERDWAVRFLDRSAIPVQAAALQFGTDDDLGMLAKAVDDAPGSPVARVNYVRGLLFKGSTAQALDQAKTIVRAYPGVPQAHLVLGDTLMTLKRFDEAAASYARAANLRFDEATMLRSVEALEQGGKRDKAAVVVALFLAQNPGNVAARRLSAHWQIASAQWDAAIDTLEGLRADIGNRDAALLAELALAYAGAGEKEAAELYAAAAYDLAPLNPAVVDAYGWVAYQAGGTDQAVELLRKAVAIAPGHGGLRWHLAQALAEAGDAGAAKANIAAALADPGFADRVPAKALAVALAKG